MSGINWVTLVKNIEPELKIFNPKNKTPEVVVNEKNEKTQPKKITNALLKLDKVNMTINRFVEEFLSTSKIYNNNEYLDLWRSSTN
jgi:hypothetical protein